MRLETLVPLHKLPSAQSAELRYYTCTAVPTIAENRIIGKSLRITGETLRE